MKVRGNHNINNGYKSMLRQWLLVDKLKEAFILDSQFDRFSGRNSLDDSFSVDNMMM